MSGVRRRWLALAAALLSGVPGISAGQVPPTQGFMRRLPAEAEPSGVRIAPTLGLQASLRQAIAQAPSLTPAQRDALRATVPALLVEQANNLALPASALQPFLANPTGEGGPTTGHPAIALVLQRLTASALFSPNCTGTLVSPDQVITAAHCVCPPPAYPDSQTCFRDGQASELVDPSRTLVFFQHAGVRTVVGISVNEAYGFPDAAGYVTGDIAVLQLDRPISWITPAQLPGSATLPTPQAVLQGAGFGWSATVHSRSPLQKATSPGVKSSGPVVLSDCSDLGSPTAPAQLCTRYAAGADSGICGGDSGGPVWDVAALLQVATASSGRRGEDPCRDMLENGTATQVEMSLGFDQHRAWLHGKLHPRLPGVQPLWPAFGENLARRLVRASMAFFELNGRYTGGWVTPEVGTLLVTANSPLAIRSFQIQARNGRIVCTGRQDTAVSQFVNWCAIPIRTPGQKFRLIATGADTLPAGMEAQPLQYVLASLPPGLSIE